MKYLKKYKIFETNINKINRFYKEYINSQSDYSKVGWTSTDSQNKRFETLLKIGVLNNETILDYGCGIGSLYEYTLNKFEHINYIGVDINPKMIQIAKSKYPSGDFRLIQDIEDIDFNYDWFLASGVFTVHTSQNEMQRIIDSGYRKSNNGVAFNLLLKDYVSDTKEIEFKENDDNEPIKGYDPDIINNSFSRKYSDIQIIDNYLPGIDFTIYLKK